MKKKTQKAAEKKQKHSARKPAAARKPNRRPAKARPVGRRVEPIKVPATHRPVVVATVSPRKPVKVMTTRKFSAKEKKFFRDLLMTVRERMTNQVSKLKGDALTRDDQVVSEEDGTDAFDRQFALTIASTENEALLQVEESLRKVEVGTYGLCENCGGAIEMPRLKALPFVKMCIGCQSEAERKRMKFRPANRQV